MTVASCLPPQHQHLKMHCSNLIAAVQGTADCTPQPPTTAELRGDRVQRVQEPLLAQPGTESITSVLRDIEYTLSLWGVGSPSELQAQQPW